MNKSEKIMNDRMTWTTRRGRNIECLRNTWLKNLRKKRQADGLKFYVVVNGWATYAVQTIRQGKILGLSIVNELANRHLGMRGNRQLTVKIYDKATMIELWSAER